MRTGNGGLSKTIWQRRICTGRLARMDERSSYLIEFRLDDSGETSALDFRNLFTAIDAMMRQLTVAQLYSFLEAADIPARGREEILFQTAQLIGLVPPPVQIRTIRRESPWTIEVGLPVAGVLWAVRKMIAPQVLKAWEESKLQESFRRFVRDHIFMGARETVEASAANQPQYGNLVIDDIEDTGKRAESGEPELRITLRRTEVVSVELKDRDLRKQFLSKIGLKAE